MNKFIFIPILLCSYLIFQSCSDPIDFEKIPDRGFVSHQKAPSWEQGLISGNGTLGALVYGSPENESVILSHALLYLPLHQPLPPVSQGKHLKEIRQLMLDGQYAKASEYIVELSQQEGYGPKRWTDPFIPAFRLNIRTDSSSINHYRRSVDFETGEVAIQWEDSLGKWCRELFVSRPDSVVVMRLRGDKGQGLNAQLQLERITECDWWKDMFQMSDQLGITETEFKATPQHLTCRVFFENQWPGSLQGYEGVVRIVPQGGEMDCSGNKIRITAAQEVLLLMKIRPSYDMSQSQLKHMEEELASLRPDYSCLKNRHAQIHGELFRRVKLDLCTSPEEQRLTSEEMLQQPGLSPVLIEHLFDAARYNSLSATGSNPPNLQGIWSGTMTPYWSGDFTTNGNLPVSVSHFLQANTPELLLPLFDRLETFREDFRTNARALFQCRGIHVPSRFSTHGLNNHFDAIWPMTFWTAGAAWYSFFYYDYFLYTGDTTFLTQRALPFMEEAALFYEDFLQTGDNGNYIFNPSYSPENNPANHPEQACINATMDVMAAKGLFRALIHASQISHKNQDKIPVWKEMLGKMPPYELNAQGEIREWMWPDMEENHQHRHVSHLLGLYDLQDPEIMKNPDLIEGCRRAIQQRMRIRRQENGGVMAFGMAMLGFSAAAIGEQEIASEILTWLSHNYWNSNLVTTHDPHAIFNLDLSGGYPSLVMKMLVYSEPGLISLLPSLPECWEKGKIQGVALRGQILLKELAWEKGCVKATVNSPLSQGVKFRIKGQPDTLRHIPANQDITFEFHY